MFVDLVSFTSLSERRDAEDVRALMSSYFDTARSVIERHGGVVEKFIGDAVMAVWGPRWPTKTTPSVRFGPPWRSSTRSTRSGSRSARRCGDVRAS